MLKEYCIAKLHRAVVTDANLNYVGSITIGRELMRAVGLEEGQMVQITNASNAVLWHTYVLSGEKGQIVLNGPPARLFQKGDVVVILGKGLMTPDEARQTNRKVAFFEAEDGTNQIDHIEEQCNGPE